LSAGNAPNAGGSSSGTTARHEEAEAEPSAAVYYCPLCGEPAPSDSDAWLTEEQLAYAMGVAAPAWMREIQRELKDVFGSSRRSGIRFGANDADIPEVPAPLAEPRATCRSSRRPATPMNPSRSPTMRRVHFTV
jgi:hypothetical protein